MEPRRGTGDIGSRRAPIALAALALVFAAGLTVGYALRSMTVLDAPSGATAVTVDVSAAPRSTPAPEENAPYLVIDRDELLALPASGEAWDAMRAAADRAWPAPDLDARDEAAVTGALAAALVYARTGETSYRDRVVEALRSLQARVAPQDLLAVVRQLGGWVVAADLVGYRDEAFRGWLHHLRYQRIGTHARWRTIYGTAGETANNYGTFALASLIAVDRFLGDEPGLARDWSIFSAYGRKFAWPFEKTADWDPAYSCVGDDPADSSLLPIAINPPGCEEDGTVMDGIPVEDAARASDFPRPHAGYVNEAMQGYAFQGLLLERAGFDAWGVNSEQVRRVAEYQQRAGIWNAHPTGYYVAWILNDAYGEDYATEDDTSGGRTFAWTSWLFP